MKLTFHLQHVQLSRIPNYLLLVEYSSIYVEKMGMGDKWSDRQLCYCALIVSNIIDVIQTYNQLTGDVGPMLILYWSDLEKIVVNACYGWLYVIYLWSKTILYWETNRYFFICSSLTFNMYLQIVLVSSILSYWALVLKTFLHVCMWGGGVYS